MPAAESASSNACESSTGIAGSSPPCSARIGPASRPRAGPDRVSRRCRVPSCRRSRPRRRARGPPRMRATSCRPPKQKPTVKTDPARVRAGRRRRRRRPPGRPQASSAGRAACTRSRPRACRFPPCARSSRTRARRSRAPRTAAPAPRRSGTGRGRPGGSRRRRRRAPRGRGERREAVPVRRLENEIVVGDRSARDGGIGGASRGRSTCARHGTTSRRDPAARPADDARAPASGSRLGRLGSRHDEHRQHQAEIGARARRHLRGVPRPPRPRLGSCRVLHADVATTSAASSPPGASLSDDAAPALAEHPLPRVGVLRAKRLQEYLDGIVRGRIALMRCRFGEVEGQGSGESLPARRDPVGTSPSACL